MEKPVRLVWKYIQGKYGNWSRSSVYQEKGNTLFLTTDQGICSICHSKASITVAFYYKALYGTISFFGDKESAVFCVCCRFSRRKWAWSDPTTWSLEETKSLSPSRTGRVSSHLSATGASFILHHPGSDWKVVGLRVNQRDSGSRRLTGGWCASEHASSAWMCFCLSIHPSICQSVCVNN